MTDTIGLKDHARRAIEVYADTLEAYHLCRAIKYLNLLLEVDHPGVTYTGVDCEHCGAPASGTALLDTETGDIFCSASCLSAYHFEDDFEEEAPE